MARMELKAKDFMKTQVVTAPKNASIKEVAELMAKNDISAVVIIDKKKVIGVMTERDMVRDVIDKGIDYNSEVTEVLSSPSKQVDVDADINDITRYLIGAKLKRLIVMKGDEVAGIISQTDLLQANLEIAQELHKKMLLEEFDPETLDRQFHKMTQLAEHMRKK